MSSAMLVPTGRDENRGVAVITIAWVEGALAIIIIVLRFWARFLIKKVGFDDCMMLFGLVIFILWCCLATYYASLGGLRHLYDLSTTGANVEQIIYINYLIQFVTTFSYLPAKTSVAALVLNIIGPMDSAKHGGWRKWLIYFTLILGWVATILNCIMVYVQCDPPAALWNPHIAHHCWDPNVLPDYALWTGSWSIVIDAVLAFIPASVIYKLNLELKKRVNLCILLGLGVITSICGIVKATYIPSLKAHADITWNTYDLLVWSGSELFVLICCGSIPTLKPLWDRYISQKNYSASKASGVTRDRSGSAGFGNARRKQPNSLLDTVGQTDYDMNEIASVKYYEGIRATTKINITSSRDWDIV